MGQDLETDSLLHEIVEREVPSLFEVNELEYDWNEVKRISIAYAKTRLEEVAKIIRSKADRIRGDAERVGAHAAANEIRAFVAKERKMSDETLQV